MVVISVVPKEDLDLSGFGGIKKAPRANSELFVLMFKCDYLIFNLAFISADKAFLFI